MSLRVSSVVTVDLDEKKTRKFDSFYNIESINNWEFKYIAKNKENQDAVINGGTYSEDEPPPYHKDDTDYYPIGTIFFDGDGSYNGTISLSSRIENVVVNTEPPKFVSENVQYFTIQTDHKCSFMFKSKVLLDVAQLAILIGDEVLFYCNRKNGIEVDIGDITGEIEEHGEKKTVTEKVLRDISIEKTGDEYTLSFYLSRLIPTEPNDDGVAAALNTNQLTVVVWDIAANKTVYTTSGEWHTINTVPEDLYPLIIEFVSVEPFNKLIDKNIEGKTRVKVTNPNKILWQIPSTVQLMDDSIGYIDPVTVSYNSSEGVMWFDVIGITQKGNVMIEGWIDVDNTDLHDYIKNKTYANAMLGPFIYADEGRKYKFSGYIPKYCNDELYRNFVMFVQDFYNTSQVSMSTGNAISMLEKDDRINWFSDPSRIEFPWLNLYRDQHNIEIDPSFDKYIYFLNHMQVGSSKNNESD